jgi:hypothetical protein
LPRILRIIEGWECGWLSSERESPATRQPGRCRNAPVTVYDRELRPGGHSHTVTIDYDGTPVAVGFIVYNELNYPDLTALFAHLGVETVESCMSFAVSADAGRFEWKGGGSSWRGFAEYAAKTCGVRVVGLTVRSISSSTTFSPAECSPRRMKSLGERFGVPVIRERIFGQDYAKTLASWRNNFRAAWPNLMPLGFDDRFRRL